MYDGLVGAGFACPDIEGEQTSPLQTDVTVGAGSARPTTNINH